MIDYKTQSAENRFYIPFFLPPQLAVKSGISPVLKEHTGY